MSAANALHHLLCKLGGSIDEAGIMSFMSGAAGTKQRYKTIVQQLAHPEHEGQKLQALMELNEVLSMSTEDQLAGACSSLTSRWPQHRGHKCALPSCQGAACFNQ